MVLGHEATGEVLKVGSSVTRVKEGDHVVCTFIPSRGKCIPCKEGRPNLCENGAKANEKGEMLEGGIRLSNEDGQVYHHLGVSGFAEHAVVSENSIVKSVMKYHLNVQQYLVVFVITGIGVVMNTTQIRPGSNVVVVGLGGIGLNAIIGAKLAGANEIIALDINEDKFDLAKQFGATATFNSSDDDIDEQIKEYVPGGVEYAFETKRGCSKECKSPIKLLNEGVLQ